MTGHEKIAARNIKGAFDWIIGENYNSYQDGYEDNISDMTAEEWKDYIYDEALNSLYMPGMCASGRAPKEMRFAGENFCRGYIDKLWDKDEDIKELQSIGKMLPQSKSTKTTSKIKVKESAGKNFTSKGKSLEELVKMIKEMNIDFDFDKWEKTDERIFRMRMVMELKK